MEIKLDILAFAAHPDDVELAASGTMIKHVQMGKKTGIIFLGGFNSDMEGQKVLEVEDWAKKNDHSFLRFDYTGHGESSGNFAKLVFRDSTDFIIFCSVSFLILSNIIYLIIVPASSPLIMLINAPFFNILKTLKGILFSLHNTTAVVSITFNSSCKT